MQCVCGRRLFIKRRRVREEAATADCQQMAAITYPVAATPLHPSAPAKCPSYGTDNRHLNCHGCAEVKEQQQKEKWKNEGERLVALQEEPAQGKKEGKKERCGELVFCSRFAGHIKNIFNLFGWGARAESGGKRIYTLLPYA